jgi:hypothetical protein
LLLLLLLLHVRNLDSNFFEEITDIGHLRLNDVSQKVIVTSSGSLGTVVLIDDGQDGVGGLIRVGYLDQRVGVRFLGFTTFAKIEILGD